MTSRLTVLFAALALSATACGDNDRIDSDFEEGRFLDADSELDLEEIQVGVLESCLLTEADARLTQSGTFRLTDAMNTTTTPPDDVVDKGADLPSFCNVSRPFDTETTTNELARENISSVCGCDFDGCVAQTITSSFGCDVCATFDCGDFDLRDCVVCD